MVKYIAHIKENNLCSDDAQNKERDIDSLPDSYKQTLCSHLLGTAALAESFAVEPWKSLAYNAGLLHDIGKYQEAFQKRIRGAALRVDHSTCGAIEAAKRKDIQNPAKSFLEYCIAGHHAGLPDGGQKEDLPEDDSSSGHTLYARLKKTDFDPYDAYKKDFERKDIDIKEIDKESLCRYLMDGFNPAEYSDQGKLAGVFYDEISFMIRYCYSCLVDADALDTERFCKGVERTTLKTDFQACLQKLNDQFDKFRKKKDQTSLQLARTKIQEQAFQNIHEDADIYLMSMPTGSGKTLCSAKCSLIKALETEKKHIIYVIPYNSIITQTAQELSIIFNDKDKGGRTVAHILRHQSIYSVEDDENADEAYKLQVNQATENWDADFIITTEVQFFETLFSNKRNQLRKMHNMADSILVFDEAHLMPTEFLQPCLEGVSILTKKLGCKAIFLTATMPDYREMLHKYAFHDLRVKELVPDQTDFKPFHKCTYEYIESQSPEKLADKIGKNGSTLVVVNTRRKARELYNFLGGGHRKNLYHLSTLMTKKDLQETIDEIKAKLGEAAKQGEVISSDPVIVISTSLIEAGVDLDFRTAYREIAGLDSILQTGGRCNREGIWDNGEVFIFQFEKESSGKQLLRDIKTDVTLKLFDEYPDISDEACVREFYRRVSLAEAEKHVEKSMHSQMKEKGISLKSKNAMNSIPFASYDGKIILSRDESVIIPEDKDAEELVNRIRYGGMSGETLRRLQEYTCSVPRRDLDQLMAQGVIENLVECGSGNKNQHWKGKNGIFVLTNKEQYYRKDIGILLEGGGFIVD